MHTLKTNLIAKIMHHVLCHAKDANVHSWTLWCCKIPTRIKRNHHHHPFYYSAHITNGHSKNSVQQEQQSYNWHSCTHTAYMYLSCVLLLFFCVLFLFLVPQQWVTEKRHWSSYYIRMRDGKHLQIMCGKATQTKHKFPLKLYTVGNQYDLYVFSVCCRSLIHKFIHTAHTQLHLYMSHIFASQSHAIPIPNPNGLKWSDSLSEWGYVQYVMLFLFADERACVRALACTWNEHAQFVPHQGAKRRQHTENSINSIPVHELN